LAVKILLLEDDKLFNETLQDFLEEEGFELDHALDPYSALELTYKNIYDLYLFDVNLPYESGFDMLSKLRQSGDTTPTIFLTSREDKASLKEGYETGADDYMKKPIDLDELLLRIEAQLRRFKKPVKVVIGEYAFDMEKLVLYKGDEPEKLPRKLAELLGLLLRHRGDVVSTEEILREIYGDENPGTGVMRVYINKLKQLFGKESIRNIRGVGYCFEA